MQISASFPVAPGPGSGATCIYGMIVHNGHHGRQKICVMASLRHVSDLALPACLAVYLPLYVLNL